MQKITPTASKLDSEKQAQLKRLWLQWIELKKAFDWIPVSGATPVPDQEDLASFFEDALSPCDSLFKEIMALRAMVTEEAKPPEPSGEFGTESAI